MLLYDEFLEPTIGPEKYISKLDVINWRPNKGGQIIQEIFVRHDKTFGFRYQAWVAYRDAGNNVRSHNWLEIHPEIEIFTDDIKVVIENANIHSQSKGLTFSPFK